MKYLLLLFADETGYAKMSPEEMKAALASFARHNADLSEAGVLLHGEPLQPSGTARTLRASRGEVEVSDGPFTESKEQLGGYYVIDVGSVDEAVKWAQKCPVVHFGAVEVRGLNPRIE